MEEKQYYKELHQQISDAQDILDKAQINMQNLKKRDEALESKLYQARCDLEDIREDLYGVLNPWCT